MTTDAPTLEQQFAELTIIIFRDELEWKDLTETQRALVNKYYQALEGRETTER